MTLVLHATPEEVMRAVETLQEFGREQRLGDRDVFGLALALEESGSNIVHHALRGDPHQTFRVTLEYTGNTVAVELRDRGPEFDPTQAPVSPPGPPNEDRAAGGWGIQLVRHYMDEICYRRENGENVLRLTKRVEPSGTQQSNETIPNREKNQ
jgi:anti-sigma regulatory factor (Ser/Thr protein kinase)